MSFVRKALHFPRDLVRAVRENVGAALYRRTVFPAVQARIAKTGKARVVFLVLNPAMWKYGAFYDALRRSGVFEPMVVAAMNPAPGTTRETLLAEQEKIGSFCARNGYRFVEGYDGKSGRWIDLRSIGADLVFYAQPYRGSVYDFWYPWRMSCALPCFVPYSLGVNGNPVTTRLSKCAWKIFLPSSFHVADALRRGAASDFNAVACGYPFEEKLMGVEKHLADEVWGKDSSGTRKRIIWAPHHSVGKRAGNCYVSSSFCEICTLMKELAVKFSQQVVFAFKPHPLLRGRLYELWGKEETEAYYRFWEERENTFLAEGEYAALFAGSDALIHDCGSFTAEYLYTGKPALYVFRKDRRDMENEFGKRALAAHYHAHEGAEIEAFVEAVVLQGRDTMVSEREAFARECLDRGKGEAPSQRMVTELIRSLGLQSNG